VIKLNPFATFFYNWIRFHVTLRKFSRKICRLFMGEK